MDYHLLSFDYYPLSWIIIDIVDYHLASIADHHGWQVYGMAGRGAIMVFPLLENFAYFYIFTPLPQWAVVATNVLSALPVPSHLSKDDEEV